MSSLVKRYPNALLYMTALLASACLSVWINMNETVINPDGICYLLSAKVAQHADVNTVMHVCPQAIWPFFSMLIARLSQLTPLSLKNAALLLDTLFSMLSVVTFIAMTGVLGGSKRVMWLAAAVILLSHEFNNVRQYIVRDHGFWAFYLVSIYCLLQFSVKPGWRYALAWSASLMLAALFRIEGVIFLLLVPGVVWFFTQTTWRKRAQLYVQLHALTLLACVVLAIWLLIHPQQTLAKLGRVAEVPQQIQHGLGLMFTRFQIMKAALAQNVLTADSVKEAGIVLGALLVGWYVVSVVSNLSLVYTALVLYAWFKRALQTTREKIRIVGVYLGINLVITFGFLLEREFLSKRYLIALSLTFMLWVPFSLEKIVAQCVSRKKWVWGGLLACALLGSAVGGIFNFGYSKRYIYDAGSWFADNVPAQASIYANDLQLMYYTRHFGEKLYQANQAFQSQSITANAAWRQYDYLAFRVTQKARDRMAANWRDMPLKPVKVFQNKRGDRVLIYKVRQES